MVSGFKFVKDVAGNGIQEFMGSMKGPAFLKRNLAKFNVDSMEMSEF